LKNAVDLFVVVTVLLGKLLMENRYFLILDAILYLDFLAKVELGF
jgi:hypothetical protein